MLGLVRDFSVDVRVQVLYFSRKEGLLHLQRLAHGEVVLNKLSFEAQELG